jgi:uncharacterized protein with HEPN domain
MTPPDDRIRHIRDAVEKALRYTEGSSQQGLEEDEILRLAVTKLVEIVGEAAKQVSEPTCTPIHRCRGRPRHACETG